MSHTAADFIVAVYGSTADAESVLDGLKRMHRSASIELMDAAIVTRDDSGKVHVKETDEMTGRKGAVRGAAIAGVFGLIFPPSLIVSAAVGGGIGALAGRLRDTGIRSEALSKVGQSLETGSVALAVLVRDENLAAVQQTMEALSGHLTVQPLSDEAVKQLFIEQGKA
ncbi:MAG TPA: DUF1269 domain-containing protein [Thermomicrobiales bacterium]|nr:DUF1269 domain-containing protein [Thermomicrobiales bacterium]